MYNNIKLTKHNDQELKQHCVTIMYLTKSWVLQQYYSAISLKGHKYIKFTFAYAFPPFNS